MERGGEEGGSGVKALTVRQPWAWLLFHGKPVENRDWVSLYRGPLAIHAAKGMTRREYDEAAAFVLFNSRIPHVVIPPAAELVRGAVIGTVRMTGCVREHPSPYFQGKYGFVFDRQELLSVPVPANGALGFWEWEEVGGIGCVALGLVKRFGAWAGIVFLGIVGVILVIWAVAHS